MSEHPEWVVVFRSMDSSAQEDATDAQALLSEAGITAEMIDDSEAGAPPGSYAVRVPAAREAAALDVLRRAEAEAVSGPAEAGDPSAAMDLKEIYEGQGTTAEIEALSIEAVLKANGIPCVLQGASEIPTLPFVVLVPQRDMERALAILEEAKASGPAAADAAQGG
jgi:type III secretory pathway lipoprotein EscJ